MQNNKQLKNDKIKKAVKGTGIAFNVVLVLCGIAITLFMAWLGMKFCIFLGV